MGTLLISIGNPLRGDDAVAHHVAGRLLPPPGVTIRSVHQLTPELAPDLAAFDTVVFIDADIDARAASLDPLEPTPSRGAPLIHSLAAGDVLLLARKLYGFAGRAYLCRLPVADFDGTELTPTAQAAVEDAAALLGEFLKR